MPASGSRDLLLHSGRIVTPDRPQATSVLIADGRIAAVGGDELAIAAGDEVARIDLRDRLVTPAFVDAHVHAVQTGLVAEGLDLHRARSRREVLDAVAARLSAGAPVALFGQGWDERSWPDPRPPTRAELDRAGGARVPVYLARVDVHSAVVSSGLADRIPGLSAEVGFGTDGLVSQEAHHRCRVMVNGLYSDGDRRAAARAALHRAAELGVGTLHELGGPHLGPYEDLERVVSAAAEQGQHVVTYWGEPATPALIEAVRADGVRGLAGDLCVDGAIGSRTAWLRAPYEDADQGGACYLTVEQIADHLSACTRAGLSGGFHCIGDAAVDAALAGLVQVEAELGVEAVRRARHRLEHVELVTPAQIATMARLGVAGSLQPAFDAAWGGPGELYEQRLGRQRAATMNPLADWHRSGCVVAYGTDAPVTPLAGWAMVADAVRHTRPDQRVAVGTAFAAATRGGQLAAGDTDAGLLAPGQRAQLALWDVEPGSLDDGGLPDLAAGAPFPVCAGLLVDGRVVLDPEGLLWVREVHTEPGPGTHDQTRRELFLTLAVGGLVVLFVLVPLAPALLGRGVLLDVGALSAWLPFRAEVGRDFAGIVTCRRDTFDFYLPGVAEIKRSVLAGHFPTWAPYEVGGAPLASLPNHGALSPMSLPYFLLPLWLAPAYVKLLEFAVAIVGMVAFLRRLGLATVSGLVAGVVFAGSGFMIMWTNWPHTRVAALIPALFWALERLVQEVRARDVVLVGAVVASMLLGGFPAIVLFSHTLAAAYVVTRVLMLYRHRLRRAGQALLAAAGGVFLGVGLSAIQIIPFAADLAAFDFSNRDETGSHLPLYTAFTMIDPYAVGTCVGGRWFGEMIPIEAIGFIGAAALPLAAAAIVVRRRAATDHVPTTFFVVAAAVLATAIWLGGPVLAALQLLPLWSTNFVGRAQSVFGFVAAVGVGVGVDRLLRGSPDASGELPPGRPPGRHPAWRVGLVVVLLAGVAVAVTTATVLAARDQGFVDQVATTAVIPALLLLVAGAAVFVAARGSERARLVGLAVAIILLVAQSTVFAHTLLPTSRRADFYPETPTHRYLTEHLGPDRYAAGGETMFAPASDFYELRSPVGHEFTDQRWKDVLAAADPEVQRTATYSSFRPDLPVAEVGRSAPLDQLAVRYWVARPGQRVGASDRLPDLGGEVSLAAGEDARCVLPGGPLRGIRVRVHQDMPAPPGGARPMLHVAVTSDGVEREGAVLVDSAIPAGVLTVSVAGEDLPADPAAQVRIWLSDTEGVRVFGGRGDLLDCSAVRPVDDGLRLLHSDAGGAVYERLTAQPRVRWASTSRVVTDASARVAAVREGLPVGTVLLEDGSAPVAGGRPAEVSLVEDERERIEVRVDAQGAGYLVVADSIVRPGWRATVDGSPVEVRHGNHAFAAVTVPAGSHTVELTYRAPGLRLGVAVTAVFVLLAAVPVVGPFLARRRRRSRDTPPGRLG